MSAMETRSERDPARAGAADLGKFGLEPARGFLPPGDPLRSLPAEFERWEETAAELPKYLAAGRLRDVLESLPPLDPSSLSEESELQRAMLLLSYFGHGYVWGGPAPARELPPGVAVPWHRVATELGRPPVLSYASYALWNWRRLGPDGPIALGNIALLQNFLGGLDEEWFVLVHVDIEARAARAIRAMGPAQGAAREDRPEELERRLREIEAALGDMQRTFERMPEGCDPYIYYNRVRPYIFGWKDHPALPQGVIYRGVEEWRGEPQFFRGETGAQTAIIPSLDALLGISHREDALRHYLAELRDYMPPRHRAFVEAVEAGPDLREYVRARRKKHPSLCAAYNACVEGVGRFRSQHLTYAGRYIQLQAQKSSSNPNEVGTGGTPFMPYLRKHRDETPEHLIR